MAYEKQQLNLHVFTLYVESDIVSWSVKYGDTWHTAGCELELYTETGTVVTQILTTSSLSWGDELYITNFLLKQWEQESL